MSGGEVDPSEDDGGPCPVCDEHAGESRRCHRCGWCVHEDCFERHACASKHGRSTSAPMRLRFPTCLCGAKGERDATFDCYFCPVDGTWLEEKCASAGGTGCFLCDDRPPKRTIVRFG